MKDEEEANLDEEMEMVGFFRKCKAVVVGCVCENENKSWKERKKSKISSFQG